MSFFSRWRRAAPKAPAIPADWHELRITTAQPPPDQAAVDVLVDALKSALTDPQAGVFDEYEELGGDGQICVYLLAPDADRLPDIITPVLHRHAWTAGSEIYRVYGNAMDPEAVEKISTFEEKRTD